MPGPAVQPTPQVYTQRRGLRGAMQRNAALEMRIRENPDDREAYAVYGDWLTERGDPRGELVAVQLALDAPGRAEELPDAALRWREQHLLRTEGTQLLGAFAPYATATSAEWRYGFLHGVAIRTVSEFLALDVVDPIEVLARALEGMEGAFLRRAELWLGGESLDCQTLRERLSGPHEQVRAFSLQTSPASELRGAPEDLALTFPRLERLDVGRGYLVMPCSTPLTHLTIDASSIPPRGLASLLDIPRPRLRELRISGVREYHLPVLERLFAGHRTPTLRVLALTRTDATAEILMALREAPILGTLIQVDLSVGFLRDDDALVLARLGSRALRRLRRLDLSENALSSVGIASMREVVPHALLELQQVNYEDDE